MATTLEPGQADAAWAAAGAMAWADPGDTVATSYLRDLDADLDHPAAQVQHHGG